MSKSKNSKGKKKQNKIVKLLVVVLVLAIVALIAVVGWKMKEDKNAAEAEKSEEVQELEFPYELEDGKLVIDSVFQFSGSNPDCNDEEGENIASINLVNKSEQHLAHAEIKITTAEGKEFNFVVEDIPAGKAVMAFEKDNVVYELTDKCIAVESTAQFEDASVMRDEAVKIDVKETTITLTNISDQNLNNLVLHCHCLLDDAYFGGSTYTYPVEEIQAGGKAEIQADECYLGEAAVVRVSQDDAGEE